MFLEHVFFGNSIRVWLTALGAFLISIAVLRILKGVLHRKIKAFSVRTETDIDDLIADLIGRIKLAFLLVIALYAGSHFLTLPRNVDGIIAAVAALSVLIQIALLGQGVINFWINRYKKEKLAEEAASVTTFTAVSFILKILLWTVVLLVALDNFGVDITALVTGLGIGGIAVALAVQNILGDLFASLSIILDKPFVIGDFIIVDNYMGNIEHIGLKSTRVRSLSGEQLIFSNSDLLQSRIRNYKRMMKRRVVFAIGVVYQTAPEKLKIIPGLIKKIIEAQELTEFDRVHFKEFGNFSLNYEAVYWVGSPDYKTYMDIQQAINLAIFEEFKTQGIEFAYPTQTLFVNQENMTAPAAAPEN
jgi:small-conductance mechanosensitive channel